MKRLIMMLRDVNFSILLVLMLWLPSKAISYEIYNKLQDYDPKAMRERYDKWVEKYGKTYKDGDEKEHRFGIYVSNVQIINQVNSQNLTYNLTDNQFADITNDEFKATYLGYVSPPSITSYASYDKPYNSSVDWRKKGVLTPIKDQSKCGIFTVFF